MDEHDRSGEGTADLPRRTAPASYAAASANRSAPSEHSAARAVAAPFEGTGPNPVYGRVTRFGAADKPAAPPSAALPASWPPPVAAVPVRGGSVAAVPAPAIPDAVPSAWGGQLPWPSPTRLSASAGPAPGTLPGATPGPPNPLSWTQGAPLWAPPPPPVEPPDGYASWGRRVAGHLVDEAPGLVASVVLVVSYLPLYAGLFRRDPDAHPTWSVFVVGLVLSMAAFGWSVYNRWVLAGRTGQSVGKRVTRAWLVSIVDGRPVGVLNAFLRDLLHTLDGIAYVGYLWPLWDDRRQTLADKIIQTVVVRTPVPPLTDLERSQRA